MTRKLRRCEGEAVEAVTSRPGLEDTEKRQEVIEDLAKENGPVRAQIQNGGDGWEQRWGERDVASAPVR